MRNAARLLLVLFWPLLYGGTLQAGAIGARNVPTTTIPHVKKAPQMTGMLSDPVWKQSPRLTGFKDIRTGKSITQSTDAYLLYDDANANLYVGIRCAEMYLEQIAREVKEHDGPVWTDDSIEILLDTAHNHRTAFHIIVNSIGTVADMRQIYEERIDQTWDSKCSVKTGRVGAHWVVEIAIPFETLGCNPAPGMVWGINICRNRMGKEPREYSAWSHTPGAFVQPQYFGHATFGGDSKGIRLLTWGNLDSDTLLGGENTLVAEIANGTGVARGASATLTRKLGDTLLSTARETISIAPGEARVLKVPYTAGDDPREQYHLTVDVDGRTVLAASQPSGAVPARPRVWQLDDPLFEPLLSRTPPGDQKNGAIYWFHSYNASDLRPFAKEHGVRYSLEEAFKELADCRFLPIMQENTLTSDLVASMATKYGFRSLYLPDYRGSRDRGVPQISGLPFILDPRSREVLLQGLESVLKNPPRHLWGIYTQDEGHEIAVSQGVQFFARMKDTYPFIREADEQIRNEFGFGKYGFPDPTKKADPFRWIAYRKWTNKQMLGLQREVYEATKRVAPELRVVSIDPVAGHKPYDLDAISPYVDIVTHQTYPSGNPNRQEVGFVTKFVADLTGKPVWPCTHVENYAYSVTPEETRELMSQVIRNGGRGFHLYMPDVIGERAQSGDTKLTRYGCPERFRAITEILRTNCEMNEVAIPSDPDCAILYSEDHYQSFPATSNAFPNEPEYAYTFLGPVARTWFRFVNDNMVLNGRADLKTFKAVFIPAAKYERAGVVRKLIEYVESGGVLICGDPEAFSWDIDGSSLAELRARLFGADVFPGGEQEELAFGQVVSFDGLKGLELSSYGPAFKLVPHQDTEVLARFGNGDSAVIRHALGKGSAVLFAFNPFTEKTIADSAWKQFFRALVRELGLKAERDIWRFKFPPFKTVYQPDPEGVCLTGNYVRWQQERPLDVKNVFVPGIYGYSLAPDGVIDEAGEIGITFAKGNLTDRRRAPLAPKKLLRPQDYVVTWNRTDPLVVTFDFRTVLDLRRVHLWYSDQLPELEVEASADGETWTQLASHPRQERTEDVLDVSLDLNKSGKWRFLKLSFGERDAGQPMTLVECEVWGETD